MKDTAFLAVRYLMFYRLRTGLLMASLTLVVFLPLAIHWMVNRFEVTTRERAERTPLVLGVSGSPLDLVLHALYFHGDRPVGLTVDEVGWLPSDWKAVQVPIYFKHRAQGYPVVGTDLEYFKQRNLTVEQGASLIRLGDCVVGSKVARELQLSPGDRLLSDPVNPFDLSAGYPLNMRVVGILATASNEDDGAVFVDLKTSWILDGIGHGHQDLQPVGNADVTLSTSETHVIANAALVEYQEITEDNADSFHFHADESELPLSAILVFPEDHKTKTLILGRYETGDRPIMALEPLEAVEQLFEMVFRVKRFFDLNTAFIGIAALLFLILTLLLSLRLREREMETLFHLGCSRGTVFWMVATEWAITLVVSGGLAMGLALLLELQASNILFRIIGP